MKIVFMGTPDFAVPSLEKIISEYGVEAVFTQPDRPKGRGKKMAFSPVKEVAVKHDIKVFQPEKLKEDRVAIEYLKELKPDFIIVVAFGQILTKEVLDIPRIGCINLHASLLPMYRGAANPTPSASYIVSAMSFIKTKSLGVISVISLHFFLNTSSPIFLIFLIAIIIPPKLDCLD